MRHSLFMSTMQDSGVKKQKRWRPGKKLVTDPDSLKHTLQDVADEEGEQGSAAAVMQMGDVREGGGKRKGGRGRYTQQRAREPERPLLRWTPNL